MSIASEIERIREAVSSAYTKCSGKGATMPTAANRTVGNLATCIDSIATGGVIPSGSQTITVNGNGQNIAGKASVNVQVPMKLWYKTITGSGNGSWTITGIPFYPLGISFSLDADTNCVAKDILSYTSYYGAGNGKGTARCGVYYNGNAKLSVLYPDWTQTVNNGTTYSITLSSSGKFKAVAYRVRVVGVGGEYFSATEG